MPPTAMDTTNAWLAVMAIAMVVQTLLMLGIAIVGWRAIGQASEAVRAQLGRFDTAANVAGHAISARVWPVVGLSRAVGAAVKAFTSRGTTRPSSHDPAPVAGGTTR